MDDEELVRRCLDGDRGAFDELVGRYRDRVYSLAVHLIQDPEVAEDLAQEAFLRALTRLPLFDPNKASFATWLMTLTTRLCLNALRRQGIERAWVISLQEWESEGEEVADERTLTPEEVWSEKERRRLIREALATLPPNQRAALLLRYGEGMSVKGVAEALSVPEGTIKAWLYRGREALRRRLKGVGIL